MIRTVSELLQLSIAPTKKSIDNLSITYTAENAFVKRMKNFRFIGGPYVYLLDKMLLNASVPTRMDSSKTNHSMAGADIKEILDAINLIGCVI